MGKHITFSIFKITANLFLEKRFILLPFFVFTYWMGFTQNSSNDQIAESDILHKSVYDVYEMKLTNETVDSYYDFEFISEHLSGISWLRNYVLENPHLFPMEEEAILSSKSPEHEAHKRWERYMRTLNVSVVQLTNFQNYFSVKANFSSKLSPCHDFGQTVTFTLENKSDHILNAEIEFIQADGILFPADAEQVLVKVLDNDDIANLNYYGVGRAVFNMSPKSQINLTLPVTYSCRGDQGAYWHQVYPNNEIELSYKVVLSGFVYNKNTEELYRVFSPNIVYQKIKI